LVSLDLQRRNGVGRFSVRQGSRGNNGGQQLTQLAGQVLSGQMVQSHGVKLNFSTA
jgi:hypothetical protein